MIPTVLLINLDRCADRLQAASELLTSANIPFKRISAVDGKALSREEITQKNTYPNPNSEWFRPLSPGEIGCFLSHIACWKHIAAHQLPYALVLEDDVGFAPNFSRGLLAQLNHYLTTTNVEWDIIKVARLGKKVRHVDQIPGLGDLCQCFPVPIDCTAYLVSFAGAQKLIKNREKLYRPVDFELKHYWERNVKIFSLRPNLFRQKSHEETSSVIGNRTEYRKYKFRKKAMVYFRKYHYHLNFFVASLYYRYCKK